MIDDRQRIVGWSNASTVAFGIPRKAALGRPCYEVVRGHDSFDRAVCQPDCPALKALRNGSLTSRCSLLVSTNGSPPKRFLEDLIALPGREGGALAMLTERGHELAASGAGASVSSTPGFSAASPVGIVHELASLATLSTSLSPDRLEQSIEQVLEWLRQASGAEAAELFLVEPQGGDMLLSAYRGPFRAAFSQITRFHPGEGFPGIVLNRGEPILTSNLPEDPFYLRTRVKDKGFHSYVCVPLLGPSGVVGVLNVATRRPHFDVERALRLLTWASQPITNVVQAGLLQVRETIGAGPKEVLPDAEQNLDAHLRAVLHKMMLVGNAVGGTLLLYDRDVQGVVRRVTEGEFAGVVCPDIRSGIPQACPALVGGHGLALSGSQRQWPAPCRQVPAGATMVYCLPMVAGGEEVGIVQLGYAGRGPSPPTKHLPALLGLAERAAQATRQAWTNLQNQQLTQSRLVAQPLADEREDPQAESPLRRRVQGAHASDDASDRPFLDIRCFGAFELYIQGRLVTSEMFQRRGALTLLKILLIHDGRQVSRDALAELLWPEADPQASANRLYVLVHTLRRVVEPAQRGQRWVFICSDGDRYYFNTEASCRLDVMDFRENLRLGERLEREEDLAGSIEAYEKAINLYRGDLLEEELYAEWCWGEREHLREMCLSALRRVARFYLEEDAPEKSVERYGQALRIDPLREENHRGLMRALLLAGRRDEALREYHLCKDNLRRELDVEPLPETEELYSLIRSNGRP